jgi:GNAT superfamily N-acetyltransferase
VTGPGVRIRGGRQDDARACAASMRAAVLAVPEGLHPRRTLDAWSSLPPLYHRWAMGPGGERYLVALRGSRPLGFAARRGGELTAVFVRPLAQRGGVGRALVRAAARAARREGHAQLRVVAALAAVPFYARLGFRAGARVEVPLPGGLRLAARRMRQPLGAHPGPAAQGRRSSTSARGSRRRSRLATSSPR